MMQGHLYNPDEPNMFIDAEEKKCLDRQDKFNEGYMAAVNTLYTSLILNQYAVR